MEYKNTDIEEMVQKVRRIRCASGPRFAVQDKVTHTKIIMDGVLGYGTEIYHIAWENKYFKNNIPQVDFKEGYEIKELGDTKFKSMKEALDIALTEARKGQVEKYLPIRKGYSYEIAKI